MIGEIACQLLPFGRQGANVLCYLEPIHGELPQFLVLSSEGLILFLDASSLFFDTCELLHSLDYLCLLFVTLHFLFAGLPYSEILTLAFGVVIHAQGKAKLLGANVVLEELISLERQMLKDSVGLGLVLGQSHECV